MAKKDTDTIKEELSATKKIKTIPWKKMLSSGSTLVNLACTNNPNVCWIPGHFYRLIGDSTSGKTWLALATLAEAANNERFDEHELIYDNVEHGALMDKAHFFGDKLVDRLREPHKVGNDYESSEHLEQVYDYLEQLNQEERKFIYILDSHDGCDTLSATKKRKAQKKARQKGEQAAGSYGDGKAKLNSERLRGVISGIQKNGSILIFVSQSRDNINPMSFETQVASGGRALKFYATLELWTSLGGKIKKKVKEKDRTIGVKTKIRVKKNRITGRDRTAEMEIYYSFGVDDIGVNIDYLLREGHWKKGKKDGGEGGNSIKAPEFDFVGSREKLIKKIEEEDLEKELRDLVALVWKEIEDALTVHRKKRYE